MRTTAKHEFRYEKSVFVTMMLDALVRKTGEEEEGIFV